MPGLLGKLKTAVDPDLMCSTVCGSFHEELSRVLYTAPSLMPPEFKDLHEHVTQLPHVGDRESTAVMVYQQARAALEWVAYHPSPEAAHVRWACFRPESGQTPPVGRPVHLSRREGLSRDLRGRYQFRVKNARLCAWCGDNTTKKSWCAPCTPTKIRTDDSARRSAGCWTWRWQKGALRLWWSPCTA